MHELSIALGIVKIAEEECLKASANAVDVIELEIGELAGIEKLSLEFAWPVAVKDTRLDKAETAIDWVAGKGKCLECNTEYAMKALYDCCPNCQSPFKDIIRGKELRVKSLVVS